MDTKIYTARWEDGTFSIHPGASPDGIVTDIDAIADPRLAEVRVLPMKLREGCLVFEQKKPDGDFHLEIGESTDYEKDLWAKCTKIVWPKNDYPISGQLHALLQHPARDGSKEAEA